MTTEDQPSGQSGRASDAGGPVHLVKRACNLCEAICGLDVSVQTLAAGPKVVAIRGDAQDPFSRGHICPKALGLMDLQTDPDRLRSPMRRVGDRFEPIPWDEALDWVATRLAEVRAAHGAGADALVFIWVGMFRPEKNHRALIEHLATLPARLPDF